MILRHTDNLSKTLQNPELASTQAYEIAMLTVKTLQSIRAEENFDLFWRIRKKTAKCWRAMFAKKT